MGPDRPGPKIEIRGRGGPRIGPIRTGLVLGIWHSLAAPPQISGHGQTVPTRATVSPPIWARKRKILPKFSPSIRSTGPTGPTRDRTEDRIWQKPGPKTGLKRTGPVQSGLGSKTAHPYYMCLLLRLSFCCGYISGDLSPFSTNMIFLPRFSVNMPPQGANSVFGRFPF